MKSDSLETCTYGGLYYSVKPLPMGFTLLHTRLIHDHLRSLLGPLTTFTTNHSTLHESELSLECQDVTLLESIDHYIYYITSKRISP